MSLTLYYHPLASFCWKALIALYETGTPFEPHIVDLAHEGSRAEFLKLWPIGKFPVLRDDAKDRTIPESSIIIEYLRHYPGSCAGAIGCDLRGGCGFATGPRPLCTRAHAEGGHRPHSPAGRTTRMASERARALLATSYRMIEQEMARSLGHG